MLPQGVTLREATAEDHDAIARLNDEVFGAREGITVRHILLRPDLVRSRWVVATDPSGRVVSSMTLLDWPVRYEDVELRMSQIEWVATDPAWRRRGLVRAQIDLLHEWADEAGCLVNMIQGIPAVYRGMGYGYGWTYAEERQVVKVPDAPPGVEIRSATEGDLERVAELHAAAQSSADFAVRWSLDDWRWLLAGNEGWEADLVLAGAGDEVLGYALYQRRPEQGYAFLEDVVVPDQTVGAAVLAHFAGWAGDVELWIADRPATPWSAVARTHSLGHPGRFHGVYARIPDPVAFLDRIRPVLSRRLAASPAAGETGEYVVSMYDDAFALVLDRGQVVEIKRVEAELDPMDEFRPAVPWDQVPALLLGRFGAAGLEARVDDVGLGRRERVVLEALFPEMRSDVLTPV